MDIAIDRRSSVGTLRVGISHKITNGKKVKPSQVSFGGNFSWSPDFVFSVYLHFRIGDLAAKSATYDARRLTRKKFIFKEWHSKIKT